MGLKPLRLVTRLLAIYQTARVSNTPLPFSSYTVTICQQGTSAFWTELLQFAGTRLETSGVWTELLQFAGTMLEISAFWTELLQFAGTMLEISAFWTELLQFADSRLEMSCII